MRIPLIIISLILSIAAPVWAQDKTVPQSASQIQLSFSLVVKRATPGVVNIYTEQVVQQRMMPFFGDPMFDRYFGGMAEMRPRVEKSLGSGVIVRPDGLVVTNAHVAKNSSKIKVVLSDRREFPAKLVLTDEKADLALLQIESSKKDFPALILADSDVLEVGDLVLAIGNPFGVGQTVTSGIVSALARTNVGSGFGYYIQTDAAINPGNSGGALINTGGEVVGINSVIISKTGGYMGIGFAIPANLVKTVVASYVGGGELQRAWFGASLQTVSSEIADTIGLDRPQGVLIQTIYDGGPAQEAGLQRGDVVLTLDGKAADNNETVRYILATHKIGETVPVTYIRKGETQTTTLKVAIPSQNDTEEKLTGKHPLTGATVSAISPALRENNDDLPEHGILVTGVSGTSQRLGMRAGDVVLAVNGQTISTVAQLKSALLASQRGWRVDILRNGLHLAMVLR